MRKFPGYAESGGQGAKAPPGGRGFSRAGAAVALAAVALAASACASDEPAAGERNRASETAPEAAWPGPPRADRDGNVAVAGFNRFAQRQNGDWEKSPLLVAVVFTGAAEAEAGSTFASVRRPGEGGGTAVATVTLDGLLDDSVRAERYLLRLARHEDGTWRVKAATRSQQCAAGRGHASFSPEPCR